MKIELWIEDANIMLNEVEPSFSWESDIIPQIGDRVDYSSTTTWVSFNAKVTGRTFYAGRDVVCLDIKVSKKMIERIENLIKDRKTND